MNKKEEFDPKDAKRMISDKRERRRLKSEYTELLAEDIKKAEAKKQA